MADLIVIGAGPGGYETAVKAAESGMEVIIIEKDFLGGVCLKAGCVPTKCLCHTAETLDTIRDFNPYIELGDADDILAKAIERKQEVVEKLHSGIEILMKTPGITLIYGEARFKDAHTVAVGEEFFSAKNIIIATGSVTKFLPIEGAHANGVVTSTEILNMTSFPKNPLPGGKTRLCIIGGGVIGMEFASIYSSFGIEVEVIEFLKEILPAFDKDLAKRLRTSMKKRGVNIHTGAAAKKITEAGAVDGNPRMTVTYEEKGTEQTIDCDLVLMAVGRAANVEAINLDDIGVEYTSKGIKVDSNMQTNIPGVYAVGDVNGIIQLAHAAIFQGLCALDHILNKGEEYKESLKTIPAVVFTVPEFASVGLTEEQVKDSGVEYKSQKSFYRSNCKALAIGEDEGIVKILADNDGKILGAHILGTQASNLIHEVAVMMRKGGTVRDIAHTVHAHPSLSELLFEATRHFLK